MQYKICNIYHKLSTDICKIYFQILNVYETQSWNFKKSEANIIISSLLEGCSRFELFHILSY